MMIPSLLTRLARERRGVAATEFALWVTLFFFVMLAALDIGQFSIERGRMAQAMSGASIAAFRTRAAVDYSALPGYLRAASGVATPAQMSVIVGCNGGQNNCTNVQRTCACLSQTGTLVAAGSCGQTCGSGASAGSRSGYYLQITASYPFRSSVLPRGMLNNGTVTQRTTVRLQ